MGKLFCICYSKHRTNLAIYLRWKKEVLHSCLTWVSKVRWESILTRKLITDVESEMTDVWIWWGVLSVFELFNCFMYDYKKYNLNSFVGHSVALQYVTFHRVEQIWSAKTHLNGLNANLTQWRQNMLINMWQHLPPKVSQNLVGNTVYYSIICVFIAFYVDL